MSEAGGGSVFPMDLLLFSAAGFDFGVEATQVKRMAAWNGENEEGLFRLDMEFGQRARNGSAGSMVIDISTAAPPFRALIDRVEELVAVTAADIRPFPALIEPLALRRGMWGVYAKNGRLFLLLDFERVKARRRPACAGEEKKTRTEDDRYETDLA